MVLSGVAAADRPGSSAGAGGPWARRRPRAGSARGDGGQRCAVAPGSAADRAARRGGAARHGERDARPALVCAQRGAAARAAGRVAAARGVLQPKVSGTSGDAQVHRAHPTRDCALRAVRPLPGAPARMPRAVGGAAGRPGHRVEALRRAHRRRTARGAVHGRADRPSKRTRWRRCSLTSSASCARRRASARQ